MLMELTVEFMGLMALVPNVPGKDAKSPDTMAVLALKGVHAYSDHSTSEHESLLAIDVTHLASVKDAKPNRYVAIEGGARFAIFELANSEVSFKLDTPSSGPIKMEDERPDSERPGSFLTRWMKRTWKDAAWLGDVNRAAGDGCHLEPKHLEAPTEGGLVSTVIRIEKGEAFVGRPNDRGLRKDVWDFKEGSSVSHTRALSDHFGVTMTAAGVTIVIRSPSGTKYVVLKGNDARAAFGSLPRPGGEPPPAYPSGTIDHFVAYHDLVCTNGTIPCAKRIPHLKGVPKSAAWLKKHRPADALASSDCPPAMVRLERK